MMRRAALRPVRQHVQPSAKIRQLRMIGIVVKAAVAPQRNDLPRDAAFAAAPPAQRGEMAILDPARRQQRGKRGLVETGVGARTGKGAHIGQPRRARALQQGQNISQFAVRMADGVQRLQAGQIRCNTMPLWAAMWSVLSLAISYCGSSGDAWRRYPCSRYPGYGPG